MKPSYLLAFLVAFSAAADLNLAPPDQLVETAGQSRIALRETILDIENNIPQMRDPQTFDSYFHILDQLQVLSTQLHLDEIYPDGVKQLGQQMVDQGVRWLDLTKDDSSRVLYHAKWMSLETMTRTEGTAEFNLNDKLNPAQIRTLADNVTVLIPFVEKQFPTETYLSLGLRQVSSNVAVKYLTSPGLPQSEIQFWLGKVQLPTAMSEYIDFVNSQSNVLTPDHRSELRDDLLLFQWIHSALVAEGTPVPLSLTNSVSDSVQTLVLQSLQFEEPLSADEFGKALSLLQAPQLRNLAESWQTSEKVPTSSYGEAFLAMGRQLAATLTKNALSQDALELNRWLDGRTAVVRAQEVVLEGLYKMTDSAGKIWYFTVVQARENLIYASLTDSAGYVFKLYFNVAFDVQSGQFTASDREPDLDGTVNPTIRFTVDFLGNITAEDLYARDLSRMQLQGKKIEDFPDLFTQRVANAQPIEGIYQGQVSFPVPGSTTKTQNYDASLVVTPFSDYTIGRLTLKSGKGYLDIELNTGTKGTDGVLYMTSVKNYLEEDQSVWVQLRALPMDDGSLQGYIVVGGRGMANKSFQLKKVK